MHWKLKSESDTEQVYAQHSGGAETGRFRYVFHDGRPTVEVGETGTHGRSRKSKRPVTRRQYLLAGAPVAAVIGDLLWHALR